MLEAPPEVVWFTSREAKALDHGGSTWLGKCALHLTAFTPLQKKTNLVKASTGIKSGGDDKTLEGKRKNL